MYRTIQQRPITASRPGLDRDMPIRKQSFIPNGYYHIYNRGHNKQIIFNDLADYTRYLKRVQEYLKKHAVTLLAYCLMPNHIHLLLRQDGDESLERFIHRLHTAYTMYFNKRYERVGAVFQGRFKSTMIETDEYLLHVSRYIHQNPIKLINPHAQGPALSLYPWSSYKEYIGVSPTSICNSAVILDYFSKQTKHPVNNKLAYKKFVEENLLRLTDEALEDINSGNL